MKQYTSILNAMRSQLWMLHEDKLHALVAFLGLKAEGKSVEADTFAEIHGAAELKAAKAQKVSASSTGSVAVMPLYGLILHRGSSMGDISGPQATSTARFLRQFRAAAEDPSVQAIVIDVDSPGGTVEGVDELAAEIRATRGKKKTIAVSNMMCASAAYYIASACDEIVASPSSKTGSIGVYCVHEDASEYLKKLGVKVTMIKFGENKAEGNPYEPLSEAALAHIQASVDEAGNMFEAAVAAGRKISKKDVHDKFGQGLVFGAKQAKALGLVDTIGTLDSVLARFGISSGSASSQMASIVPQPLAARADGSGSDGPACECDCDGCMAGDCDDCSTDDCNFAGCTCPDSVAKQKKLEQANIDRAALSRKALIASL
jgi:signal peptide peptidase SppA